MRKRFLQVVSGCLLLLGGAGHAAAASLEALQGAWVSEGTECADTFKKSGKEIEFKDRGSSLTTGLLIRGESIVGPNSTCKVERVKQGKDHLTAYMGCADSIMFSNFSVSFRMLNATSFERFDTEFPDSAVTYNKCDM